MPTLMPSLLAFWSCIRTLSTSAGKSKRKRGGGAKEGEQRKQAPGLRVEVGIVSDRHRVRSKMCSTFSLSLSLAHTLLPSGIVHVLATLTEAPDSAIWRNTGVEAAGDVAAIRASSPFEIKRKKQKKRREECEKKASVRKPGNQNGKKKTLASDAPPSCSPRSPSRPLLFAPLARTPTWSAPRPKRGGVPVRPRLLPRGRAARRWSTRRRAWPVLPLKPTLRRRGLGLPPRSRAEPLLSQSSSTCPPRC